MKKGNNVNQSKRCILYASTRTSRWRNENDSHFHSAPCPACTAPALRSLASRTASYFFTRSTHYSLPNHPLFDFLEPRLSLICHNQMSTIFLPEAPE